MTVLVGALGSRRRAEVDEVGVVAPAGAGWDLMWWIGADDRWRLPFRETAVRQSLLDEAPVVQTAMRVPGGDAVHRVYGIAGTGDPIVVEVENDSPAPFVVAFVVRGARTVGVDVSTAWIDSRPALVSPRAPSRWATAVGRSTDIAVCSGGASTGPFVPVRSRAGRAEAALLHPVPHRTTIRVALVDGSGDEALDPRSMPSSTQVARGWRVHLDRGMRVELPEDRLAEQTHRALTQSLLRATGGHPSGDDIAAVEDWGFDVEAAEGWSRASGRERRRAGRRKHGAASWREVDTARETGGADLLVPLRSFLVHESDDVVTILGDLPAPWRGAPIEVQGAPTRSGSVSYALRWHGDRPALLWDMPSGVTLRAPSLDPTWSTADPQGEALLAGAGTAA